MGGRRARRGACLLVGLAAMLALAAPGTAGATVIAWSSILPDRDYGRADFVWLGDESAFLQTVFPSILPFRPWEPVHPFPLPSPLPPGSHPFTGSVMDQFSWNLQLLLASLGAIGSSPPAAVPEPGAAPLAALAAAALAALHRRR